MNTAHPYEALWDACSPSPRPASAPRQHTKTPKNHKTKHKHPEKTKHHSWWSAVTGLDLIRYGTTADADEIRDTAVAQPLLVSVVLVVFVVFGVTPDLVV